MSEERETLTIKEAAELAGVSKNTIRNWVETYGLEMPWGTRGKMPVRLVYRDEIERTMTSHTDRANRAEYQAENQANRADQEPGIPGIVDIARSENQADRANQAAIIERVLDLATRHQSALEAAGSLAAIQAERDRLLEEVGALRRELKDAQEEIIRLRSLPLVAEIVFAGKVVRDIRRSWRRG